MNNNIITLYHGTTHDFANIDVSRGKPFKDFGRGFYLTAVRDHALNLARRNRPTQYFFGTDDAVKLLDFKERVAL